MPNDTKSGLSSAGKGLFKRAILHGGSALSSWAIVSDPLRYSYELASRVNCSIQAPGGPAPSDDRGEAGHRGGTSAGPVDHAKLLQCIKYRVSAEVLGAAVSWPSLEAPRYRSAFGPVVDGRSVLPNEPSYLMAKASSVAPVFEATAVLVGVAADEATRTGGGSPGQQETLDDVHGRQQQLRTYVQNVFRFHRQKIYDVLAYHYT